MATTKQAAVKLRDFIRQSQDARRSGRSIAWTVQDGALNTVIGDLPPNLRFEVRATRAGVNITIQDAGYVDEITNSRPELFGKPQANLVKYEVDELRRLWPDSLPGTTKWGPIFSVKSTGVTHVDRDGNETSYVYCDRCRAEIPKHGVQRHQLAGPDGLEELCGTCNEAMWEAELSR